MLVTVPAPAADLATVSVRAASTVNVTVVPCTALGAVPATSTVYVPGGGFGPGGGWSVEPPPAATVLGPNEAVAPCGRSKAVSCTVSAVPWLSAVEIVVLPPAPCSAVTLPVGAIVKSFWAQFGNLTDWM